MIQLVGLYLLLLLPGLAQAQDMHFPARQDTSPEAEVALLPQWPKGGPDLAWVYEGIGNGYSAPGIDSAFVYVSGEIDGIGYLFCFDLQGLLKWKAAYGPEWTKSYTGSRAAPTIADNLVYVCSGLGHIVCFEKKTGRIRWSVNMIEDLKGVNNVYGYSMKILIKDNWLFCLPGGISVNIAALDRFNGKPLWTSSGVGETAGYADPILIELPDRDILVCYTEFSLMGIDAKKGKLLWTKELSLKGEIPCNTPIYDAGYLYTVAGPGNGAVKYKLSQDGSSIEEVWRNLSFDTYFGGFVKNGNYLYGAIHHQRVLGSVDASTGKMVSTLNLNNGAPVLAGGMLFYYNEHGSVALIDPSGGKLKLMGTLKIGKGTKEHFAHPVIGDGNLYIRHGNALLVYDIRKK